MYAIIVDGGRQYKVTEGQELVIDYRDASSGDALEFGNVIAYSNGSKLDLGSPLAGGESHGQGAGRHQGPKLTVQKFRRRKTFRRRTGHRQLFTKVQIDRSRPAEPDRSRNGHSASDRLSCAGKSHPEGNDDRARSLHRPPRRRRIARPR